MAQPGTTMKARSLDKNEVMLLINFISSHKVITSKATNATNNRLKEEAWNSISQEFSAHVGETRRPEQLRLKWENLKKAARKRSALIRQNNLKTGGGKSYIGPDEALDRVASMLGATCNGFTVEFGGDREDPERTSIEAAQVVLPDETIIMEMGISNTECGHVDGALTTQPQLVTTNQALNYTPKAILFNTPNSQRNKRQKLSDQLRKAQIEKELSLAAYFKAKTHRLELENLKLKIEIEELQKNTK